MNGCLMMSAGGITIDDEAQIAAMYNLYQIIMILKTEWLLLVNQCISVVGHG